MWKFLGSVISSFLFLRDLFGYILPGAFFLGMVVVYVHTDKEGPCLQAAILPQSPPKWLLIAGLIVTSYVLGHIFAAVGFTVYGWVDKLRCHKAPQIEADLLYYRYLYPQLFNERDRRDTINILRIGLAVAFCAGAWFLPLVAMIVSLILGVFMIYNGYTGQKHVADYSGFTLEAARRAEQNNVPFFRWDGCCDKDEKKDAEREEQPGAKNPRTARR